MPERKIQGILAVLFTLIGTCMLFFAYYLIWTLLRDVFIGTIISDAKKRAVEILILFICHGLIYFLGLWMSHLAGFRLETRLREKGIKKSHKSITEFL